MSASLALPDAPGAPPGGACEEALALARERAVLPCGPGTRFRSGRSSSPVPSRGPGRPPRPSRPLMRAAADRDTGGEAAPGVDLDALRRSVVDDLMRR